MPWNETVVLLRNVHGVKVWDWAVKWAELNRTKQCSFSSQCLCLYIFVRALFVYLTNKLKLAFNMDLCSALVYLVIRRAWTSFYWVEPKLNFEPSELFAALDGVPVRYWIWNLYNYLKWTDSASYRDEIVFVFFFQILLR